MSEFKLISPMLDNFDVGDSISEHDGVQCFPAMRKNTDERYIVKTVSIPASQKQLDALLLTGAFPDAASALTYFNEQAENTVDELETLKKLSQLEGFLPYEDWQITQKDDGIGFDVHMISSYKRSLRKYFQRDPITHLMAVNLGLDLCAALAVCRRCGYLYADLKPNNIYLTNDREFRIGDLGFLKLDSLKYVTVPDKYRSQYSAPELQDPFAVITPTIDIYAVGLILYQAYNGCKLPFEGDNAPAEKFDAPLYADYEMSEIILKACHPDPAERWQDPIEMGQALVSYMQRNGANDTPIVPDVPVVAVEEAAPSIVSEIEQFLVEDDIDLSDIDLSDIPEIEGYDQIVIDSENMFTANESDEKPSEESTEVITEDEPVEDEEPISEDPEEAPSDDVPTNENDEIEDNFENLNFLDNLKEDETSPENNISDVEYDEVSVELTEILSQADALVAHPVPEPVVAPDAPEITIPEISEPTDIAEVEASIPEAEQEIEQAVEQEITEELPDDSVEHEQVPESEPVTELDEPVPQCDVPAEEVAEITAAVIETLSVTGEESAPNKTDEVDTPVPEEHEGNQEVDEDDIQDKLIEELPQKSSNHILRNIIIFLLIAIIAVAGFLYYKFIYLQPINSITIDGDESSMIVSVASNVDESLLSVVCSDAHGTQLSAPVVDGVATFANLKPDTGYNVSLVMDGFHKLTGETAVSYSTPAQTNITEFNAITGDEDGSVNLDFKTEGPNSKEWSVSYVAAGEEEKVEKMLSDKITITGLTVGKEYTFTLVPGNGMYITGNNQIKFTASNVVLAQDIEIISVIDGKLTVAWTAPEDSAVETWTVRCYNTSGYLESIITSETTAEFESIDPSSAHTIEVFAAGMSKPSRETLPANAASISNFEATPNGNGTMNVTWNSSIAPDGGWILMYNIDGIENQGGFNCSDTNAQIKPLIPGANYQFTLQQSNGNPVLAGPMTFQAPDAQDFSGYGMTRNTMDFATCKCPGGDWTWDAVPNSDYINSFAVGETISMVGNLQTKSSVSDDMILITYVFYDQNGSAVCYSFQERTWRNIWSLSYGEFDVTKTPEEAGNYTLSVYFNGKLVTEESITIY